MAHHYIIRKVDSPKYDVRFLNESTGKEIRMTVPHTGAYEDPDREITPEEVQELAEAIVEVLRDRLGDAGGFSAQPVQQP